MATKGAVRLGWHVRVGRNDHLLVDVDCDTSERAEELMDLYGRVHSDVHLVTVIHPAKEKHAPSSS